MRTKERTTAFHCKCNVCKERVVIKANPVDWVAWKKGKLIQFAMPYLEAGERELLMTGICEPCYDKMFGEEE